jgi:hypothetical protein
MVEVRTKYPNSNYLTIILISFLYIMCIYLIHILFFIRGVVRRG